MRGHVLLQYYARARMAPPAYIVTLVTKATAAVSFLYDILTLPAYSRPVDKFLGRASYLEFTYRQSSRRITIK